MNVALIGGGITNSLVGFFLKVLKCNIDLWEAEKQIGGRMFTLKINEFFALDVGAQYLTTTKKLISQNNEIYSSLIENNKVKLLSCRVENMKESPGDTMHYVAPQGMSSLAQHFLDDSNLQNIYLQTPVSSLNIANNSIEVESANGIKKVYNAVVITTPIPVLLTLSGNFKDLIDKDTYEKLNTVLYSCRYCLMLFYEQSPLTDWAAKYTPDDSIFRYVAIQEKKVDSSSNSASVIFHTTIQFPNMCKHMDEEKIKSLLLEHVGEMFPDWANPLFAHCYKWEYSQVLRPFSGSKANLVLSLEPLIIIAGDAFTESNFDNCVISAKITAQEIINSII